MVRARAMPQLVTVDGRLVAMGGWDGSSQDFPGFLPGHRNGIASIEELDVEGWTWSMLEIGMREERYGFSAVAVPRGMVNP